jgi:hypothetical protein
VSDPRAYTKQEIIDMLMDNFRSIADYWATVQLGPEHEIKTPEEDIKYRCEGWCSPCLAPWMGLP